MNKRILWIAMSLVMIFTNVVNVSASPISDAKNKKKDAEKKLNAINEDIEDIEDQKEDLEQEAEEYEQQLVDLLVTIQIINHDIENKEDEIETAKAEYEVALAKQEKQQWAMNKRIKYMYEKGDFQMLDAILREGTFSDMLNYFDYVNALSAYDRKMLVQYQETRDSIARQEEQLEQEKQELSDYKVTVEAEQSRVSGLVSSTSNSISQYSNQISQAEAEAEAYENQIKQQEADLTALRKKLAEEIAMSKLAAQSYKRDISQVSFAEEDRYLLANLIYCEAGGEPYAGKLAVGAVVINRVLSSVYPDTVTGVIYQRAQFSPVASGRLALALAEGRATQACYDAADEAMSGVSNVGDCVYFRTPIEGLSGISIGGHIFY